MPTTPERPRPASRRRSAGNGGIGPLFGIMAAIVVAVIIVAFLAAGGGKPEPGNDQHGMANTQVQKSGKKTDWDPVEPWHGVAVGMTRQAILDRFGEPNIRDKRGYRGYEILEFYDNPELAGIIGNAGGTRLSVYIDLDTDRVVYFVPPKSAEQAYQEHLEGSGG